jgi:catechol 2,3-dioxygenase-like lactoylglutathione lyase family enzyme
MPPARIVEQVETPQVGNATIIFLLNRVDHVGYLARDVERAARNMALTLGLQLGRRFERQEFSLYGCYLDAPGVSVEVFSFTEPALVAHRLERSDLQLDHVAYQVSDIEAVAARMRRAGVRFCSPDGRIELREPLLLSEVQHLWTIPETSCGQSIQLLER